MPKKFQNNEYSDCIPNGRCFDWIELHNLPWRWFYRLPAGIWRSGFRSLHNPASDQRRPISWNSTLTPRRWFSTSLKEGRPIETASRDGFGTCIELSSEMDLELEIGQAIYNIRRNIHWITFWIFSFTVILPLWCLNQFCTQKHLFCVLRVYTVVTI